MIPGEQLNSRHYGELIGWYTEENPAGVGSVRREVSGLRCWRLVERREIYESLKPIQIRLR